MKNILFNCYSKSDLNDNIFNSNRTWISSNDKILRKDDDNLGFITFKKKLSKKNYNIHTQDVWKKLTKHSIDLQINFAYHQEIFSKKTYLLLPESREIYSKNDLQKLKKKYTKIFCQYDDHVDEKKIFKINYPFIIKQNFSENFTDRPIFSCMISSNKSQKKKTKNDLYNKRFEIIKFMEKKELNLFHLYGLDWNLPFKKSGIFGRIYNYLNKILKIKTDLSNYKGVIKNKNEVLTKSKFVFCIENASINGYISDPIFDAFNNGCVPIYLGAKNVNRYIPENTFINMRDFSTIGSVFDYLKNFDHKQFDFIQSNIIKFINSDKVKQFNEIGFASTLLKHLDEDLK